MHPARCLWLGRRDYQQTWDAMQQFTRTRSAADQDQIWFLEHPPVFTQGQAGRQEHILAPGDIPVVATDRGGQVTYHGPGQLVVYPLLDLQHLRNGRGAGIRTLVECLEQAIVTCLSGYGIQASGDRAAPGVYVAGSKIASIGLRVRRHCCYHGIAVNVAMNLEPFSRINPCGYEGLAMTQISDLGGPDKTRTVARDLKSQLGEVLGLALEEMEELPATAPLPILTAAAAQAAAVSR